MLVKVPLIRHEVSGGSVNLDSNISIQRPRLAPITQPSIKSEFEYSALSEIFKHFGNIEDPRFSAIRVLDYISEFNAILMEEVALPSLNRLFFKASRFWFTFPSHNLDQAFRNAGAWLGMFHQLPRKENVSARHTNRFEFVESINNFTSYLGAQLKDEDNFNDLAKSLETAARRTLPESLPEGLAHGDFAMRNILIGNNSQVTVLDTLARWRTSIFEDIGYFLIALNTTSLQVFSRGLAFNNNCLSRYEREFLLGYFDEKPIPAAAIRLYEVQALLDKWSARLADLKSSSQITTPLKKLSKLYILNRYFKDMLNRLVTEI